MDDLNTEWLGALELCLRGGREVAPRGKPIRELDQFTISVDMTRPVITIPGRKLNYRFMAAEALWMINGDQDVASLSAYNPNIAQFSDDGITLAGAYGPRIKEQLSYVISKLAEDQDTRQATLTLWQPNPTPTKDLPCTVAMDFKIRDNKLNMHVFMRSSDLWWGVPYDVFSFSMVATDLVQYLRYHYSTVMPGTLFLTAASSHLYEPHWQEAESLCLNWLNTTQPCQPTPPELYQLGTLRQALIDARDSKRGDKARWWAA